MTASHGCYSWKSSEESIISINYPPNKNKEVCHSEVMLQLKPMKTFSDIIWIKATDKTTKDILKCETQISAIQFIEITTELSGIVDVGNFRVLKAVGKDQKNV